MTDDRPTSLDSLPVELLYRILDDLPCEEVFFSFGHVCRRFRRITQTYHRYNIVLSRISKPRFDLICRRIRPEDVLSLTLSNGKETPGQLSLFLSSLDIKKFTHLRHLTLIEPSDSDRTKLRRGLKSCPLVSLKIRSKVTVTSSTGQWLTSLLGETQLSQLTLQMQRTLLHQITWPTDCSLTFLRIDGCQMEDYLLILRQLPSLQTLVVDDYQEGFNDQLASITHSSLKSLTIKIHDCSMNTIKSILSLTPSLRQLKLFSSVYDDQSMLNGKKWEEFFQLKLFDLETFRFSFIVTRRLRQELPKAKEVIELFRSPFWLEKKRWFTGAELRTSSMNLVHLYTIPLCDDRFHYSKVEEQAFAATPNSPETRMEQIQTLDISTTELQEFGNTEKDVENDGIQFPRLTNLHLSVSLYEPIQHLSALIDMRRLERISLRLISHRKHDDSLLHQLNLLLQKASNVHSLNISRSYGFVNDYLTLGELAERIPLNIRHIEIEVAFLEEMNVMVEKIPHLYSLTFRWCSGRHVTMFGKFSQWLDERGIDYLSQVSSNKLHLWLGERSKESEGS